MARPIILLPPESAVIQKKCWELVDYFAEKFPRASIKIDVKYRRGDKFTIQHRGIE